MTSVGELEDRGHNCSENYRVSTSHLLIADSRSGSYLLWLGRAVAGYSLFPINPTKIGPNYRAAIAGTIALVIGF
jgi:hypothetical protein